MNGSAVVIAVAGLLLGLAAGYLREPSVEARPVPGSVLDAAEMKVELSAALSVLDTLERASALQEVLSSLGPGNAEGALEVLDRDLLTIRDCDLRAILSAWADFDPAAAFEAAAAWTASHKRGVGLGEVAWAWALDEAPLEARLHANTLRGRAARNAAMTGLVFGWAESGDIQGVTEHLANYDPGPGRIILIGMVASSLARRQGAQALLDWADSIGTGAGARFKAESFRAAVGSAAEHDPELASRWWETQQDQEYALDSLWLLLALWMPSDPNAALEWGLSLAPSETRDEALQSAIRRYYELDRGPALRWLARVNLPPRLLNGLPQKAKQEVRRLRRPGP